MRMKDESKDKKLKREGWTRMFDASEPSLSEAIELYESLGLEGRLEPLSPDDFDEDCRTCLEGDVEGYKTIYTRPKKKGDNEEKE